MKCVYKNEFCRKAEIGKTQLRTWLAESQNDLEAIGQTSIFSKRLNYKSVLYLCHKYVIDPAEFYPDMQRTQLEHELNAIIAQFNK